MLEEVSMEEISREVTHRVLDMNEPYLAAAHAVLNKHGIPASERGVFINQIPRIAKVT